MYYFSNFLKQIMKHNGILLSFACLACCKQIWKTISVLYSLGTWDLLESISLLFTEFSSQQSSGHNVPVNPYSRCPYTDPSVFLEHSPPTLLFTSG